jgi:iron-sulfur cluster repair protein YtfE (RIC family)
MAHDPIQRLLDEHADLRARLEPLRRAVRDLPAGGPVDVAAALRALRDGARILTTDLIAHARREDEAFFPAVEEAMGGAFGPTSVMRQEHVSIHDGADRFRGLVEGNADAGALRETGAALLGLIDDHFAKEEQVLFPLSRNVLDAESLRAVALRMEALDGA